VKYIHTALRALEMLYSKGFDMIDPIYGNAFKKVCDFDFRNPAIDAKKNYIVYSPTHHHLEALTYISNNPSYNYVLVTHNSDESVNPVGLPVNLVHWYAQNLNCNHPKISPLPIGLENPHWHPAKIGHLRYQRENVSYRRLNKGFAQFNPNTNKQVRVGMLQELNESGIDYDWIPAVNGRDFDKYATNLLLYKFCFCPRGNGIDTHRLWEALYMGCIPVIKRHRTHDFEESDLPIIFLDNWSDFRPDMQPESSNWESRLLTMSYWENKIRSSFDIR